MERKTDWESRAVDWNALGESEREELLLCPPEDGRLMVLNMPNEVYHRGRAVSASGLKRMMRSAFAYKHGGDMEETAAMAYGTLCHAALLEPNKLNDDNYAMLPRKENGANMVRNKAHKEYKEWLTTVGERTVVTQGEWESAREMALSVRAVPEIARYLNDKASAKYAEVSIFWKDEETGLACRCRPDLLVVPHDAAQPVTCFDLKTVKDSSYNAIQYDGEKYRYHPMAASFYASGLLAFFGRAADWILIAAEKTGCREVLTYAYEVGGSIIPIAQYGRAQVRDCMTRLAGHMESGLWPRQDERIREMHPSSFFLSQQEHLLESDENPF